MPKSLHRRIYNKTVKPLLNVITFRPVRKYIKNKLLCKKNINKNYINSVKDLIQILKNEDIVYAMVSIEWNAVLYHRHQHMALKLAQKGYKVLYAEYNNILNEFKFEKNEHNIIFVDKNIFEYLPKEIAKKINLFIPNPLPFFTYEKMSKLSKLGYNFIYDYLDAFDDAINGGNREQLKVFNNLEKFNPFLILATAKNLYEQMVVRFDKKKVLLNQNAVNILNFQNINSEIPSDLRNIIDQNRPVVGYIGALAPWIDWKLLNFCIEQRPQYNFVLIGVDYGNALKNLNFKDNVYFLGSKKHNELPQYLQYFTCCTIPFESGDIAKSTNPLKLFEYMASGKQVICTKDLLECYGFKGVYIANDMIDFVDKIDMAIANSDDNILSLQLKNYANLNTWEKRIEDIIDRVNLIKGENK